MNKNLIVVEHVPAMIKLNFDGVKNHITDELKKYDVVVTHATIKACKKLATDINKVAGEIDAKRKSELSVMTAPIKEFDGQMKELVTLCKDGRTKLTSQIKVFEDETRREVEMLLDGYRGSLWHDNKVADKFQRTQFDDLVLLTSMTAAGNLSSKAKNEIEIRVAKDLAFQQTIEKRLLMLENASYKAGLAMPLEEGHVSTFLYGDDESYDRDLQRMLETEVKREADRVAMEASREATRIKREQAEKEHTEKQGECYVTAKDSLPDAEPDPVVAVTGKQAPAGEEVDVSGPVPVIDGGTTYIAYAQETTHQETPAPAGKATYRIQALFEVTVPDHIPADRIIAKLRAAMLKGGITSLKEIRTY